MDAEALVLRELNGKIWLQLYVPKKKEWSCATKGGFLFYFYYLCENNREQRRQVLNIFAGLTMRFLPSNQATPPHFPKKAM